MSLRASVQLLQPPRLGRLLCTRDLEVIFLCDGWSHKPMLEVSCLETALLTGMKELPSPDFGGPSSISQDEGASTAVTGSFVS
ncbi:hypothetical protein Forpi1262_v006055 [Fusarium oxysporum f. sp. raphani]|uniref:Uncharacterized protein n=1 Tax=Fusarium oxysporum f. sp. raphani TaxID=96318 RepID=A0A8J5Q3P3_FUSOX|nr:hypothetical protein Forpi1262_v006055 [Fusarium oxysporum f. sp. raphani]